MRARTAPRSPSSPPRDEAGTAAPLSPRIEAIAVGKRYPAAPLLPSAEPDGAASKTDLVGKPVTGPHTRRATVVLDDVSFKAAPGDRIVLLGPPGSGKSTLIRILARAVPPSSGRIILRGRVAPTLDVASSLMQPERTGRANVGVLARLFQVPRDVLETSTSRVGSFAELGKRFDLQVKQYSTSERRRLAMSTMLTLAPDILLLDESLTAVDPDFQEACIDRIAELCAQGTTLVFTARRPDVVERLASRALVLDAGRIVESGAPSDLMPRAVTAKKASRKLPAAPMHDDLDLDDELQLVDEPDEETLESVTAAVADEAEPPAQPLPPEPAEPAPRPAKRRAFNDKAALVSGAVYTVDGEPADVVDAGDGILIEIEIEIATASTARLVAVLEGQGRRLIRLVQPEAFTPERPGLHTGYVFVPGGTLPGGSYSGRIGAWLDEAVDESAIVRGHAFRLDVLGEPDDGGEETVERTDLAWTVTRGRAR